MWLLAECTTSFLTVFRSLYTRDFRYLGFVFVSRMQKNLKCLCAEKNGPWPSREAHSLSSKLVGRAVRLGGVAPWISYAHTDAPTTHLSSSPRTPQSPLQGKVTLTQPRPHFQSSPEPVPAGCCLIIPLKLVAPKTHQALIPNSNSVVCCCCCFFNSFFLFKATFSWDSF